MPNHDAQTGLMRANSATIFETAVAQGSPNNSLFCNILRITSLDARICESRRQPARLTTHRISSLPGVLEKKLDGRPHPVSGIACITPTHPKPLATHWALSVTVTI